MKEKFSVIRSQFNWRMLLMRIVMYALLLALVVLLIPGRNFYDVQHWLLAWAITAVVFGAISAIVRPIVQFFTLPFIFATYGLVVLVVNIIILLVFNWVFRAHFQINGILGVIWGALLITLFGGFLESMLGLTAPVVPDSEEELRKRIRFQDRGMMYAMFKAAPAELQKYAPVAGGLAEPLPSSPDTQDAQAILAVLGAAPAAPAPPPESPPPKPRRRLRRASAQSQTEPPVADASTTEEAS